MMSSRLLVVLGLTATALCTGCSKNTIHEQPTQAAQAAQPQSSPAWTLSLKSVCASAAQNQCLAKYGFSVDADGKYQVGPGPQGQLRKGMLTDKELSDLNSAIQPVVSVSSAWGAENHESDVENESDDTMTLSRPGDAGHLLAHNTGGDLYFVTPTSDITISLHAAIHDLANSYYHLPFGDACGDAADKIGSAADALISCQTDSDCVYIDAYQGFEVVPPQSVQWLLTEDCTAVKPPVVANKLMIQGGSQTLVDLYTAARTACGAEFNVSNLGRSCSYEQKATSAQPACVQNRCQSRL